MRGFSDYYKLFWLLVIGLVIIVMWLVILLHPVYFAITKGNVAWILLYLGLIPECIVGIVITKILTAIMEAID